ncbi:ABC-2 type transport system ATP-binding protein [Georgenia satyanarayanai]|uniref:ABC-2 type transport system ATP-binding protein n=1 Tax=Georgenia satyanarayanai TaxID=860221 RepID=A0A2Y9AY62_9MICO|nr:ABC transporter ATP-binding protein [Georgenia satyanarayanai]PYF96317.1 ABC-2 type transport system ATP-binding protein [Georgenia satyanarayanai]SSA47039.1 ABC-2 type transport system ATP-binding protein [Georgenia satyanarayanai]
MTTTDTSSVITVTGVQRRYGSGKSAFTAVRGVDLTVRRGELFALLGTNGAGKTSLLEVVEGIAPASAGSVRVLGRDPYRERHLVRPRTGIMLQEAGFPADLTTAETARMWHGTLGAPMPVAHALELVGLRHRASVQVKSLSGGERRRLDLALAIMGRPEVLFLDEPTTGLDPQSRRDAWELVRQLLEAGTTVVLTTHYLEEAEELADRLAIMHGGRVVREGTVAEIVAGEPARIRYRTSSGELADPRTLHALPALLTAGRTRTGLVEIESHDLQATLTALLERANAAGEALANLEASHASLERAFLAVAGEDDDAAAPPVPELATA